MLSAQIKENCQEIKTDTSDPSTETNFEELQDNNGIGTQITLQDLTKDSNNTTILDENNNNQQKTVRPSVEFHELLLHDGHFTCLGCDNNDVRLLEMQWKKRMNLRVLKLILVLKLMVNTSMSDAEARNGIGVINDNVRTSLGLFLPLIVVHNYPI